MKGGVVRLIRADYKGGIRSEGWDSLRQFVLKRDGYKCMKCGRSHETLRKLRIPLQVHHIRPKEMGGTDDPNNLVSRCQDCHKFEYRHRMMKRKIGLANKRNKARKAAYLKSKSTYFR